MGRIWCTFLPSEKILCVYNMINGNVEKFLAKDLYSIPVLAKILDYFICGLRLATNRDNVIINVSIFLIVWKN